MSASMRAFLEHDRELLVDVAFGSLAGLLLVVSLVSVFSTPSVSAEGARPRVPAIVGTLSHSTNDVRRRFVGALAWRDLAERAALYEEDAVYVADASEASILLVDGSRLDIDANSLIILSLQGSKDGGVLPGAMVELRRGSVSGQSASGTLAVRFNGTTARLGGHTRARVQLKQDSSASVTVAAGDPVLLSTAAGEELSIDGGERRQVLAGGAVDGAVQRLGIELLAPDSGARLLVPPAGGKASFAWRAEGPAASAQGFTLELATDPSFASIIARQVTRASALTLSGLAPAIYYWRVSAQGDRSLTVSEERKLVFVEDVAPVIMRPGLGQVVDLSGGGPLALAWTDVPGAASYLVEVERAGSRAVVRQTPKASLLIAASDMELVEAEYTLRVRGVTLEGVAMAWSEQVTFRLATKPVLQAPELYEPRREAPTREPPAKQGSWWWGLFGGVAYAESPRHEAIVLRWEKISAAAGYLIEIATEPSFAQVVVRERVPDSYFKWVPPAATDYFWRVRAFDASGREGQLSETRRLSLVPKLPELLAPPEAASYELGRAPVTIACEWKSEGNDRFVFEVAREADFQPLLMTLTVNGPRAELRAQEPGTYHWRVRVFDERGAPGLPSPARQIVVRPAAPELVKPTASTVIGVSRGGDRIRVALQWSARAAAGYEAQIAKRADFAKLIATQEATATSVGVDLGVGEYYWRVRTRSPQSRWSAVGHFTVAAAKEAGTAVAAAKAAGGATQGSRAMGDAAANGNGEDGHGDGDGAGGQGGNPPGGDPASPDQGEAPAWLSARSIWHAVPRIGVWYDFEAQPALRVGAELLWEPVLSAVEGPVLSPAEGPGGSDSGRSSRGKSKAPESRLGVALRVSYYTESASKPESPLLPSYAARLHAVPIDLVGIYGRALAQAWLRAGIGIVLSPAYVSVSGNGAPERSRTVVDFGVVGLVGLEQAVGPGAMSAELAFCFGSDHPGLVTAGTRGVLLALGYRLPIL